MRAVEDPNPGQQGLKQACWARHWLALAKVEDPNPGQQGLKPRCDAVPNGPSILLRTRIQDNKD